MSDDFAEYIYGTRVKTSEDGRVWEMTPQSERRERVVRCRDCAKWRSDGSVDPEDGIKWGTCREFTDDAFTHKTRSYGFCYRGERGDK